MVDQIDAPKVNTYADIGGSPGYVIVSKVTMYAIVNDDTPPPPPPPTPRRIADINVSVHRT